MESAKLRGEAKAGGDESAGCGGRAGHDREREPRCDGPGSGDRDGPPNRLSSGRSLAGFRSPRLYL